MTLFNCSFLYVFYQHTLVVHFNRHPILFVKYSNYLAIIHHFGDKYYALLTRRVTGLEGTAQYLGKEPNQQWLEHQQ